MKIAFCLSGQPRTWERCLPTWRHLEKMLVEKTGATVDYFCHAWNFNTAPHAVLADIHRGIGKDVVEDYLTVSGNEVLDIELERLIGRINPVSFVIENQKVSKNRIYEIRQQAELNKAVHGENVLEWIAPQFYSIMYAAHLKKKYEIENNFRYDIVFRLRYDLFLGNHQLDWFFDPRSENFQMPQYNHFYSCHTGRDPNQFPFHRVGDIFWYADSITFDRICDFYRFIPMIGSRSFNKNKVGPEHALYFYAKMLHMEVISLTVDPKIFRSADYLNLKKQAGLEEGLGGHELI